MCTAFDFSNAGLIVSLNILSAFLTHCIPIDFSVHCTQYFNQVSATVVGSFVHLAFASIIFLASSALGRIAVLYNASQDFLVQIPVYFAHADSIGAALDIAAPISKSDGFTSHFAVAAKVPASVAPVNGTLATHGSLDSQGVSLLDIAHALDILAANSQSISHPVPVKSLFIPAI